MIHTAMPINNLLHEFNIIMYQYNTFLMSPVAKAMIKAGNTEIRAL